MRRLTAEETDSKLRLWKWRRLSNSRRTRRQLYDLLLLQVSADVKNSSARRGRMFDIIQSVDSPTFIIRVQHLGYKKYKRLFTHYAAVQCSIWLRLRKTSIYQTRCFCSKFISTIWFVQADINQLPWYRSKSIRLNLCLSLRYHIFRSAYFRKLGWYVDSAWWVLAELGKTKLREIYISDLVVYGGNTR